MQADLIVSALERVMKKWARQLRAEERDAKAEQRRRRALLRSSRSTIKDAAYEIMEDAYLAVSDDNSLPAHARQIMYQARGQIQEATGEWLDDRYFTQGLLPDYMRSHPRETKDWNVVFDARGHLREPHTGQSVPLGTIQVRHYLAGMRDRPSFETPHPGILFSTHGPKHRYKAILFIEKEGFFPLFESTKLAERHDLAIMSTKGMSVTASRRLIEELWIKYEIPLLVLHDFDKSGFSIVGTLQRSTRRYSFREHIKVIDLGLRLTDVREQELEAEAVALRDRNPAPNLRQNGADEEEVAFLCSGRRVELNALTSRALVAWIDKKLHEAGVEKVVPDEETLHDAYRECLVREFMAARMQEIEAAARAHAQRVDPPADLEGQIRRLFDEDPAQPWDLAVSRLAAGRPS